MSTPRPPRPEDVDRSAVDLTRPPPGPPSPPSAGACRDCLGLGAYPDTCPRCGRTGYARTDVRPTRIPDELGLEPGRRILAELGVDGLRVQAVSIDWQANEVDVTAYVLDKAGRLVQGPDGDALTTIVTYPCHRPDR